MPGKDLLFLKNIDQDIWTQKIDNFIGRISEIAVLFSIKASPSSDACRTFTLQLTLYIQKLNKSVIIPSIFHEEMCEAGKYLSDYDGCLECGENTYSFFGDNVCTDCPYGKISAPGSMDEYYCTSGNDLLFLKHMIDRYLDPNK